MARIVPKEESGLVLGADGRWYHEGELASHQGISRFFHKQIRKDGAGRFYLENRIDLPDKGISLEEHVYFEAEDTAYFVESVAMDGEAAELRLRLNTGAEVAVDPGAVVEDEAGFLYARLPSGDEARFGRHATLELEPALELVDGSVALVVGGRSSAIGRRGP